MNIKMGIIGLPNIGKSTLFNILSKQKVKNKNFPFCTIKSNKGIAEIYDKRIEKISKISKIKKINLPKILYIDIAGIIKNSYKGYGLGNKFLNDIKKTNILIHVIRIFKNKNIININKNINPIRDIKIIKNEMKLYDLINLDNIIKKKKHKNINIIKQIIEKINYKKKNKNLKFNKEEKKEIKNLNLISIKPIIYLLNYGEKNQDKDEIKKTKNYLTNKNIILCNIKKNYKNQKKTNKIKNKINNISIKLLKLISFFTIKKKKITS